MLMNTGTIFFSNYGEVLFCKVCNVKVSALKRFTVEQHISREKHTRGVERQKESEKPKTQLLLTDTSIISKKLSFNLELCQTLLLANIPLNKLNNEHFRKFLEKYIKVDFPDESTLRRNKIGQTIATKMENVILKNNRFKIVTNISEMLDGEGARGEDIPGDLTTDDMTYFKYAPITSVDVERSFSSYKHLLTDQRRHLLFDNIRHILIVQCNNAI
ncbi:hypothetical protein QTP88_005420 [Uroleucon formosanum]